LKVIGFYKNMMVNGKAVWTRFDLKEDKKASFATLKKSNNPFRFTRPAAGIY